MKNYTITVNGNVYDVVVEEGATTGAPVARAAAPKAAPVAAPKAAPAAPKAAGAAGSMLTHSTGLLVVFSALSGILQLIPTFINLATIAQKKQNKETIKGAIYSVAGGLAKI